MGRLPSLSVFLALSPFLCEITWHWSLLIFCWTGFNLSRTFPSNLVYLVYLPTYVMAPPNVGIFVDGKVSMTNGSTRWG